jgi:hypothetical protein
MPESLNLSPVVGKFITPISHAEDLSTEVRSTSRFRLKKVLCLGAVCHVTTDGQVLADVSVVWS